MIWNLKIRNFSVYGDFESMNFTKKYDKNRCLAKPWEMLFLPKSKKDEHLVVYRLN
jgi:hypothetical protein